jgi:hypothetical protein
VPGGPHTLAGFTVSPDDRRIAVAVRDYLPWAKHPNFVDGANLQLYVEDLHGGGHHDLIFATSFPTLPTNTMEWPLAWHQNALVVAVGNGEAQNDPWQNPYAAAAYHVASAATGLRQATVCDQGSPSGPIVDAGTACWSHTGTLYREDWAGGCQALGTPMNNSLAFGTTDGALSPDGSQVALPDPARHAVRLLGAHGASTTLPGAGAYPLGWIDARHLVVASDLNFKSNSSLDILDTHTKAVTPIDVSATLFSPARDIFLSSLPAHQTGAAAASLPNPGTCP